jgi:DNA-binding NarL/FixJ family response regulator
VSRPSLRTPAKVCFLAQNCLAEAYLGQLLRHEPNIRPLLLKHFSSLSPAQRMGMIFVIDQCGLEAPLGQYVKHLRSECADAKFLVLDDKKTKDEIVRLLVMGIHGYVPHEEVRSTLVRAVLSVAANQLWAPPDVFQEYLAEVGSLLRHEESDGRNSTTPREEEILELVRKRFSNREIAEALQIRVSTVKFHLSNILSKLHARSRHDLTGAQPGKLWKLLL